MPSVPARSTVRRTLNGTHRVADILVLLTNVCNAGAQSAQVQSAPAAKLSLTNLQTAVTAAITAHASKVSFVTLLATAAQALRLDFAACAAALRVYESAVGVVAAGNGKIINNAGLPSRAQKIPPAALGNVTTVHQKPGKLPATAILTWPAAPRATGYAIQVNATPQIPGGPFTALGTGSGRRRVVTGPAPGSQILVQVAAVAGDGTQTAWSEPILVTTR